MSWNVTRIVWIDCETTGVDPDVDLLLEVAVVVTTGDLIELGSACWLVDHDLDEVRALCSRETRTPTVNGIVVDMHERSGLFSALGERAGRPFAEIDLEASALVTSLCGAERPVLGGCSPWIDRYMTKKYLPGLYGMIGHRTIDSSTLKMALVTWAGREFAVHKSDHRALPDARGAVDLARSAKQYFAGLSPAVI